MTSEHYDVVIIGAGPGGYTVALRSAELGKSVLVVERDDVVGHASTAGAFRRRHSSRQRAPLTRYIAANRSA